MEKMEHQIVNRMGSEAEQIDLSYQQKFDLGAEMLVMRTQKKWKPSKHHRFPLYIQNIVRTLMILSLKDPITLEPRYPQCLFYKLPRDILYQIINSVVEDYQIPKKVKSRISAIDLDKEKRKLCMLYFELQCKLSNKK